MLGYFCKLREVSGSNLFRENSVFCTKIMVIMMVMLAIMMLTMTNGGYHMQ